MFLIYDEGSKVLLNSKEIVKITSESNSVRAYLSTGEVALLQSDEPEKALDRLNDIAEAIIADTVVYDCTKPIGSWKKKSPGRPKSTKPPKEEE